MSFGPPDEVGPGEIWLGQLTTPTENGYYEADSLTYAQLAQFIRKLTIGDATKDSDDYISSWIMGNFHGGGQVEEYNEGAEASRFYVAVADTTSPNRNALGPLVTAVRPNASCTDCYPLDVGNDGIMYHAFLESGTWEVWGFNEATLAFDFNGGAGVALGGTPVGKAIRFDGVIYVPLGSTGYVRVTGAAGVPTVSALIGAADPTTAAPTSAPRPVAFAIFHQWLWAITATGGIAYHTITQKDAGANAWHWPVFQTTTDFPHIEASATPKAMAVFPDKNGIESIYVKTDRGLLLYDENNPSFFETHVEFPPHPDINQSFCIWPPGGDLHAGVGLSDLKYSTAFVVDARFGLARDHGLPNEMRGSITDLEPTVDRLYALVGGVSEVNTGYVYNDTVGSAGTGNGQFADVRGLSVTSGGNVDVCDENNERIQRFDSNLTFSSVIVAGGAGTGDGQFASNDGPYDLAHDSADKLFVVDRGNARVQRFSAAGAFEAKFGSFDDGTAAVVGSETWTLLNTFGSTGSGNNNFDTPRQVAVDSSGNTYTADALNNRVVKRNSSGTFISAITGLTDATGVAVDSSGNIYVSLDPGGANVVIKKYNSSHVLQWTTASIVSDYYHLATDGTYVWVAAAGSVVRKYNAATGAFVSSTLFDDTPYGIATDGTNLYVADVDSAILQILTVGGSFVGNFPIPAGCRGVAVDSSGRIYSADFDSNTVFRYTSTGTLIDSFSQNAPDGIAIHTDGTVWVTNTTSDNLTEWELVVVDPVAAIPPANGSFNLPNSIDIKKSSGRIYVVDGENHRVQYFTSAGVYEGTIGSNTHNTTTGAMVASADDGKFNSPSGIAVNQATGEVYVLDRDNDRVQIFSATGTYLGKFGGTGTGDGQFTSPFAIAINPVTNNVFVTDEGRDDVQEFTSAGGFVRRFGSAGTGNGQFDLPLGIAIHSDGVVYVSDTGNEDVQEFISATAGSLTAYPSLHCWDGQGWHGLWKGSSSATTPRWLKTASVAEAYRLWWGMNDGFAYYTKLRRTFHNARTGFLAGIDEFASTGFIETGFFDAAMEGFDKIASHLIFLDATATSDETITVEFKVDSGGWEPLGTVSASANKQSLPFDIDAGFDFAKGRRFNKIAFKFTMARGSTTTLTPLIDAITLHFTKIPQNTTSFQLSVPLNPYKDRNAFEQYNDLTALVTAGEFLALVHRRDSHESDGTEISARFRVLIASISGTMDTGQSGTARAELSLIAIPDGRE
jgi:DNA-binding beta-propeller fold protein YncE